MSNGTDLFRYAVALCIAIVGISGAVALLINGHIKQPTLCVLVVFCIFSGLWVGYSDRVKELTLSVGKMSMVLTEMKDTQRDIKAREEKIQKLATLMSEFVAFQGATSMSMEGTKASDEWLTIKMGELHELAGTKVENPFTRIGERLATRKPNDDEQLKQIWADFWKDVEGEVAKMKSAK